MHVDEYRAAQANAMSEADLQTSVIDMAEQLGWLCYHTHDSRRSQSGFPDLTMVRRGRLIFVELKKQKGKVSPDQQKWLDALTEVWDACTAIDLEAFGECSKVSTVAAYVWRPSDLLSGTVLAALR